MEGNTQKQSWWKRNWKWVVPVGGCLTLVVIFIVAIGSIVYGVSAAISDSNAQKDGMEAVVKNEQVVAYLGEPIETNGMTGGSFNSSNGFKTTSITVPIKGPKGEATMHIEGEGVGDTWSYSTMQVFIESEDVIIDLLANEDPDF